MHSLTGTGDARHTSKCPASHSQGATCKRAVWPFDPTQTSPPHHLSSLAMLNACRARQHAGPHRSSAYSHSGFIQPFMFSQHSPFRMHALPDRQGWQGSLGLIACGITQHAAAPLVLLQDEGALGPPPARPRRRAQRVPRAGRRARVGHGPGCCHRLWPWHWRARAGAGGRRERLGSRIHSIPYPGYNGHG